MHIKKISFSVTIFQVTKFFGLQLVFLYWEYKLVRFPSSCCEWFIVIADFGGFREVKHLLIIFSLYRFEFHTKILIFTVFEMSNFVNQAAFAGG